MIKKKTKISKMNKIMINKMKMINRVKQISKMNKKMIHKMK